LWSIIIGFVISLAVALLTPKPKIEDAVASGIEDFSLPTVSESRNVTLVWGRRKVAGPNVFTYANLKTIPIEEEVDTGLFSSDDVTVGYEYYLDIGFSICYGEATLRELQVGDYLAWEGTLTEGNGSINKRFLFGYDNSEGGMQGSFTYYRGTQAQASDAYLNSRVRQQPGFKGVAYFVWRGGYIGNSASMRPWSFVVESYPNPLSRITSEVNINGDANPAYCMYEVLTNKNYGRGFPTNIVDSNSFIDAALTLESEGLGVSMMFDQKIDCSQLVKQLEEHINGNIYFDPESGTIKLNLVRDDYIVNDLPVLDENNIVEVKNFNRTGATNLVTEVKVRYIDRAANYKDRVAPAIDTGTRQILGKPAARTLDFFGFSNATAAGKVALRDLRTLGAYLAQCTIVANRDASEFYPGQPFKFVWGPLNIAQLIMRAKTVDVGTLESGKVTVAAIEDVFGTGEAIFDPNPDSGWTPVVTTPLELTTKLALSAPYWFAQEADPVKIIWFAEQRNGDSQGYNIWAYDDTVVDINQIELTRLGANYTPFARLSQDLDKEGVGDLVVKGVDQSFGLVERTLNGILATGRNMMLIYSSDTQHEFVAYQGFSEDAQTGDYTFEGVQRGMLDTVPMDFSEDDQVWFLRTFGTDPLNYIESHVIRYKLQAVTQTGEFDISTIGVSTVNPSNLEPRYNKPYPPGRFYVNGTQWPTGILGVVQLDFTWQHRQRSISLLQTQTDDTGTLEANVTYTIRFTNEGAGLLREVTGLTGTSYSYTVANYTSDGGGTAPPIINAEIKAVNSVTTLESKFKQLRKCRLKPLFSQTVDANDATLNGLTLRNVIPAAAILTDAEDGTITLSLTALAGAEITIDEFYIGHQAASGDAYDFDTDRVQVFFDNGNANKTIAAGATVQSDPVAYDVDRTKNLVFSAYFSAANASYDSGGVTGAQSFTKSGNDAATIDATGYSTYTANRVFVLTEIV
jgi:hypothetical protein